MPGSKQHGKKEIKEWVQVQDIHTIVDVGPGKGTYAQLLGNKYEYIGIEIWEPYVEMWELKKLYKEIIIGSVAKVEIPKSDLIIFGDVLEHMDKKVASDVLHKGSVASKHVIVSIPIGENPYGQVHYGNEYEKHLSEWGFDEMKQRLNWEMAIQVKDIGIFAL